MPQVSRILLLFSLVLLAYPADCLNTTNISGSNETQILIDGEGYVLANGEQRAFYQGYSVVIKGVDAKGESTWIELLQNGTSVSYGIFKSEDCLVYPEDGEIFNITIDHIYVGSQKDLVFFYVRQCRDPDLPEPAPSLDMTPAPDAAGSSATSTPQDAPDTNPSPGCGAWMAAGAVLLCVASKRYARRQR
ncbi:MAG: S-layer protein domain-containing protein [Euryarchaeota archaeon]|nr:S-layer protein domain-containing protein [Euryarchaeota archaeon]